PVENFSRLVDESGRVVRCIAADRDDALYVIFSGPGTPVRRFDARTKVWSSLSYPGGPTRRLEDRLVGKWPTIYELPREVVVGVGAEYPSQPSLSTPWIRVAGEAGEMRIRKVWLLHEGFPPARLCMSVGYDYSDSTTELGEWKVSATERVKRFVLPRQRCRAARFIIQAVEDEGTEATHPVSLVALRVEVARPGVAVALSGRGVESARWARRIRRWSTRALLRGVCSTGVRTLGLGPRRVRSERASSAKSRSGTAKGTVLLSALRTTIRTASGI